MPRTFDELVNDLIVAARNHVDVDVWLGSLSPEEYAMGPSVRTEMERLIIEVNRVVDEHNATVTRLNAILDRYPALRR